MSDRWNSPPEMSKEMLNAAYRSYVDAGKKGYVAFQDIVDCFRAAFDAKRAALGQGREEGK